MVSLVMVVFDILVDETAHMSLAKRNHPTEALLFDRADEPLAATALGDGYDKEPHAE